MRLKYFSSRITNKIGSSLGYRGEEEALGLLEDSIMLRGRVDILQGNLKIEVKTSCPKKRDGSWNFCLYRQRRIADYFLLICKNSFKETEHVFLIPDKDLAVNNLAICINKIDKYAHYVLKAR